MKKYEVISRDNIEPYIERTSIIEAYTAEDAVYSTRVEFGIEKTLIKSVKPFNQTGSSTMKLSEIRWVCDCGKINKSIFFEEEKGELISYCKNDDCCQKLNIKRYWIGEGGDETMEDSCINKNWHKK